MRLRLLRSTRVFSLCSILLVGCTDQVASTTQAITPPTFPTDTPPGIVGDWCTDNSSDRGECLGCVSDACRAMFPTVWNDPYTPPVYIDGVFYPPPPGGGYVPAENVAAQHACYLGGAVVCDGQWPPPQPVYDPLPLPVLDTDTCTKTEPNTISGTQMFVGGLLVVGVVAAAVCLTPAGAAALGYVATTLTSAATIQTAAGVATVAAGMYYFSNGTLYAADPSCSTCTDGTPGGEPDCSSPDIFDQNTCELCLLNFSMNNCAQPYESSNDAVIDYGAPVFDGSCNPGWAGCPQP